MLTVPNKLMRPNDGGFIYEPITVEEHMAMPRTDLEGNPIKLSSNILKDGTWTGSKQVQTVLT